MEILINILLVFILINTALKLSFWELRYLIIWSIVLGLFILGVYPYAMEQSRTQIEHWLQDSEILGNIAVMISLEVLICIEFCFISLNNMYDNKAKKWHNILDFYPFDTHTAGGSSIVMTVNGMEATFSTPIKDGEQMELYWEK